MRAMQAALKPTVLEAAALVEGEMKALVPVDTGALRDSIHIEQRDSGPYFYHVSVHPAEIAGNRWGLDPAYARRIEYGFIGTDSLGRNYHQAPQPYVRPAADNTRDAVMETLKAGFAGALA
jgi:HK97 gp10 family phage protein